MRVLHVIAALRNSSGTSQVAIHLTDHLARLGCSVALYHLVYDGMDPIKPSEASVEVRGFPRSLSRKWGYSRAMGRALADRVSGFDVVHVHGVWQYPSYAACHACRRNEVPYIIEPAGAFEPWSLRQRPIRKKLYMGLVERKNLAAAATVLACSEQEAHGLRLVGLRNSIVVIPNGVSELYLSAKASGDEFRARHGLDVLTPVVLFLSRLHPKKGLDVLAASFARVAARLPNARLVIAGRPAPGYLADVKKTICAQGIDKRTLLVGDLCGEKKISAYRAADVFVLPSRSENFGIAVVEAMACGTPVVVSRETPWSEVERYGAGRWAKLDSGEFAQHIIEILEDGQLRRAMGQNGRALVREKYTWDRIAPRVLALYEGVVRQRSA